MGDTRRGRQTPTCSVVLPYTESIGSEAVDLYNSSGRTAQDWQALMVEDIMAVNQDGNWVHMKFGWSAPRRNGKSEILIMRVLYALTHENRILYTAHRAATSHNAWEKITNLLGKMGYVEDEDFKTYKRYGAETIEWLTGEGSAHFRTRSNAGGLGEGFDLLIIDEAQEYTSDQETALKYVVSDSKNPQTLMCGTPPTVVSSGDVFQKLRQSILTGKEADAGWAEWSVPKMSDTHDRELWYETNPSLGTILTERNILSELGEDQVDDNIQRLGLWVAYSQKSAISEKEWLSFKVDTPPELEESPRIFYGVKFAQKSGNVSLAAAVRTKDGRIFVEAIDCRSVRDGNAWMVAFFRSPSVRTVAIDGAAGAPLLSSEMKDAGTKCRIVLPTVKEVVTVNSLFEQSLFDGKICHAGQPSLVQAVANCEHRPIGNGGGFGFASLLEQADASLVEAVALAHWAAAQEKEQKQRQVIVY